MNINMKNLKINNRIIKSFSMKKSSVKNKFITTVVASIIFVGISLAQAPQAIPYQAVARNSNGVVLAFRTVGLKFTVFDTISGTRNVYYVETTPVTTNSLGLFMANIGQGIRDVNFGTFSSINWGSPSVYIQIEIDTTGYHVGATDFRLIGIQQLMSVPYALYANTAALAINATNATRATSAGSADNGVPVGTIVAFAGPWQKIPTTGWALCDGTPVSTTDTKYAALFAVIGYSWGGSGSTFYLPETRGIFLRGQANGFFTDPNRDTRQAVKTGGNTGDAVGSYQSNQYLSHRHGIVLGHNGGSGDDRGYILLDNDGQGTARVHTENEAVNYALPDAEGNPIIASGGSETRPNNVYVNYMIKL